MALTDESAMLLAVAEGQKGHGRTAPNPPVGAVITRDGEVLGTGWHEKAGQPHAERNAIADAKARGHTDLSGSIIYVTLEPCSTYGRTPPCVEGIMEERMARCVIGSLDPDPRHQGVAIPILEKSGISVSSGVCLAECDELLRGFRTRLVKGRPWIMLKVACTQSGHTRLAKGEGRWISGPESREDVQRLRAQCDGILVGGETARFDDPRLNLRGDYAKGREALSRYVLSGDPDFQRKNQHLQIFNDECRESTAVLDSRAGLDSAMQRLGERGHNIVMVESGGRLADALIDAGLVDELVIYVGPAETGEGQPWGRFACNDFTGFRFEGEQHIGEDVKKRGIILSAP